MTAAIQPGASYRWLIWSMISAVIALLYLPLVPPVVYSLEPVHAGGGLTIAWYGKMWQNPLLTGAIITSVETGVVVAIVATVLALAAAMAIRELKMPRLVLVLMLLPLFVPGVSMGLAVAFFFNQIGIPPSFFSIVVVQVLWALPFATLVLLTAMSTFDPAYIEAAHMSGASRWQAFRDIELPLIWPGVTGATTFSLILSFNETIRTSLVQGPYNTVQTYIWSTYKQIGLSPTLYALMTLLLLLTLILAGLMVAFSAGRGAVNSRHHRHAPGH
jgi:ABC-type spermidine/putrescine transport system permease subunit II